MKTSKGKGNRQFILLISIVVINLLFSSNVYTQETEDVMRAYMWYYSQRNYPLDTVPSGAYGNAISQRDALRQANGYQLVPQQWELIGPKPFGWTEGIRCSGRTNNVKYDPRDLTGNTIYITGADGGVWKTTDGGTTWQNKSGNLPTLSSGAFALDAQRNILYYGTGGGSIYFGTGMGMGVFMSTDDGTSWVSISNRLPTTNIYKIAISPNDPSGYTLFAAEFHGLYKTVNRGTTWTKIIPTDGSYLICTDVCFSPDGSKVYAIGPSADFWPNSPFNGIGYWRSEDGGVTFVQMSLSTGFPHADVNYGRSLLAVSNALETENRVYILSYDNDRSPVPTRMYVYKSIDGGSNFVNYSPVDLQGNPLWIMGANAGFNEMIRCSDVDPDICFMGFQAIYRTADGGLNWFNKSTPHPDHHALDFNPYYPNKITTGCDGGVFRSENLGDDGWITLNENLSLSIIYRIASNPYDPNIIIGGFEDYGYGFKDLTGGPIYWRTTSERYYDGSQMLASPFKSNYFSASTIANAKLEYSTNGPYYFDDAGGYVAGAYAVPPMSNHPYLPGIVYTLRYDNTYAYLLKSTDYGYHWNGGSPVSRFTKPDNRLGSTLMAISSSNPSTIIMDLANGSEFWHYNYDLRSRLYKSLDGGSNWLGGDPPVPILIGGSNGIPDRFFTHVEFDPINENEVYLTVSGYESHHVFRSMDGGYNWTDINGNLPDNPVNDLIIRYVDCNNKELIVATDVGVFRTDAANINWIELASALPNCPVLDLDYNQLSGMLRASAWGRSVWKVPLSGTSDPVYVRDHLYITDNMTLNHQIVVCNGGKLTLGHSAISSSFTINFDLPTNEPGIIVMNGGTLEAPSNNPITLTSQSGNWGGIEFQGSAYGTLTNCTFQNTSTPVVINGAGSTGINLISISNCNFYNGPVQIDSRANVTVQNSTWNYNSGNGADVCGVSSVGSDGVIISNNTINYSSSMIQSTGISLVYGNNDYIQYNHVNNTYVGISISNSSPLVKKNVIASDDQNNALVGISFDNSYSAAVSQNSITNYHTGFYMYNSSPLMLSNTSLSNNSTGSPEPSGLNATYNSSPRLRPTLDGGTTIWDAGLNELQNTSGTGLSIRLDQSTPDVDQGYNKFYGTSYYISGTLGTPSLAYYATNNCWVDDPPISSKFNISGTTVIYQPYTCSPPGGGGGHSSENELKSEFSILKSEILDPDPPQPIIVNYGHGIFDTVMVRNLTITLSPDRVLLSQASKQELLGNFQSAINTYQQIIQNYQDSSTAIESMRRILRCRDRMNSDTSAYSQLRSYYQTLAQANQTDTDFVNVALELAEKTLVRKAEYPSAITGYEDIISSSNDSLQILCCELNIIETYLLMQNGGGNSPNFVGRYTSLRPLNVHDALRMINEKLGRHFRTTVLNILPKEFILSQNYPNPFNAQTKINFALPNKANVTMKIYDILGRVVKTLIDNEFKDAGYHTVTFDGTNLASGIYFYRIEAGKFIDTKKMVIVK